MNITRYNLQAIAIVIVDLPERCVCGSEKGSLIRDRIETPNGELLAEVSCEGCGKLSLISDKLGEEVREIVGKKFRPTWYYDPERNEIIHWSHHTSNRESKKI